MRLLRIRWFMLILVGVSGSLLPSLAAQQAVDQAPWDQLLRRYAKAGLVDYHGLLEEREALARYLASLRDVDPAQLASREERLAFWINAYNACVITGVLDHAPLTSVKQVKGFFERIRYSIGGDSLTLNEIETQGRALRDWRIHFALVCASSSCPPLRAEAYAPERLDAQLAEQTTQFLRDPQRGLRVEGNILWLSTIFKWYTTDFVKRLTADTLLEVLAPYADPATVQTIRARKPVIKFLDYDWTLNRLR